MPRKRQFINKKSRYCCEDISNIENYEKAKADNFVGWVIHHRDERRVLPSGMVAIRTYQELKENGRYYNCPANELIYLSTKAHGEIHPISEEHRKKLSDIRRGTKASEETRKKMSRSHLGRKPVNNSGWKHTDEWKNEHTKKMHEKSEFYQKFGMTRKEYKAFHNLTESVATIYNKFKRGELV